MRLDIRNLGIHHTETILSALSLALKIIHEQKKIVITDEYNKNALTEEKLRTLMFIVGGDILDKKEEEKMIDDDEDDKREPFHCEFCGEYLLDDVERALDCCLDCYAGQLYNPKN